MAYTIYKGAGSRVERLEGDDGTCYRVTSLETGASYDYHDNDPSGAVATARVLDDHVRSRILKRAARRTVSHHHE